MWFLKSLYSVLIIFSCSLAVASESTPVSETAAALDNSANTSPKTAIPAAELENSLELIPFIALYRGEALGMAKKNFAVQRLSYQGDQRYRFESEAKALVYSVEEAADFFWQDSQVIPQRYWSETQTLFRTRRASLDFNYDSQQIYFNNKGKTGVLPMEDGAKDPLSSFIALGKRIKAGAEAVEFPFVKGTKSKVRRFRLVGMPRIDTEYAGPLDTYHLVLETVDPGQKTDVWLLQEHPYIVARIDQRGGDEDFLLELTQLKLR